MRDSNNPVDIQRFYRSHQLLRHRGPDDEGFVSARAGGQTQLWRGDETVKECGEMPHLLSSRNPIQGLLGHRRLSIIDLSAQGHQPMGNPGRGIWVVFNGEIYNYIEVRSELKSLGFEFQSHSDTEVLLKAYEAWGDACTDRLDGMWAFVIWDQHANTLLLCRDRAGMKPLYYFHGRDQFILGSEMRFIRAQADLHRMNVNAAYAYLQDCLIDNSADTFIDELRQVRPAHMLKLDFSTWTLKESRYWDPRGLRTSSNVSTPESLLQSLTHSIDIHLRSDVPLGVALSGGVDSTAIACMIHERFPERIQPLHTFSVTYSQIEFSEAPFIDNTISQINSEHTWVNPDLTSFQEDWVSLLLTQEIPVRSLSVYAQKCLMRSVSAEGVKVILGGQGSDEIFGGYSYYHVFAIAERLRSMQWTSAWREAQSSGSPTLLSLWKALKVLIQHQFQIRRTKRSSLFRTPTHPAHSDTVEQEDDIFWNALYADFSQRALPEYLHYEDRNSMSQSVESRLPFLGKKLMEMAFALSIDQRLTLGVRKKILRESLKGHIPNRILEDRVKRGFISPQSKWQRETLKPHLDAIFASPVINNSDLIDPKAVRQFYSDYQRGVHDQWALVWRIACFTLWKEIMINRSQIA